MKHSKIAKFIGIGLLGIAVLGLAASAQAQQQYIGNSFTNPAVAPGAPAGSYSISDIESVNLANGNLNISLPLMKIGGRGSAGYTMMLPIEYKWTLQHVAIPVGTNPLDPSNVFVHHYFPVDNWAGNNPDFIKYSPGAMRILRASDVNRACGFGVPSATYGRVLSRIVFIGADGTQLEFYDQRTKGKPAYWGGCNENPDAANRGTIWETNSGATFVSDSVITEYFYPANDNQSFPSGFMLFPDGNRYRVEDGKVMYIIDKNGNKINFTYSGNNLLSITDSIGHVTTITHGGTDTAPDIISFKGSGGVTRTIEVGRNLLGNLLKSGQTLKSTLELFPTLTPDVNSNDFRNPRRVAYVKLPDGRQYNFKYDSYSDIARIEYPTGGAIEYEWDGYIPVPQLMRWITERREYPNGETGANYKLKTKYEYFHSDPGLNGKPNGNTKVTQLSPSTSGDVSIGVNKHYFFPISVSSEPFTWDTGKVGKEYKTENYNSDGSLLLNKVENEFVFRQTYSYTYGNNNTPSTYNWVGLRPLRTTTTLADVTPNLVSKTEFGYDPNVDFNRQTDVYEYEFGNNVAGELKRHQHTDFLTTNPNQGNADYLSTSIYLRELPSQTWVSSDIDGVNKVSLTDFEYDNYTENPLELRSSVFGHDTTNFGINKTTRGNPTKVTTYSKVGDPATAISSKSKFDILGNVVKSIDPKGYESTTDYSDRFGSPDGEALSNTIPTELGGLSTFAFPTSGTNRKNWILGYAQFDFYTGIRINTEDINGNISKTMDFDLLDRPKKFVSSIGTLKEQQTSIVYDDINRRIELKKDLFTLNDNLSKAETFYDGLGRTFESRKYESDGGYIAANTEFDALSRTKRTSNPYRPLKGETPVWSENSYDALGRLVKVKTPDGAEATTDYFGNAVTVTDQALKKRRSITNALGQLIRIDEPNDAGLLDVNGSPAQPTSYVYNTLGNLVKVSQGNQNRFFKYDSLGRLIRLRQPEQATNSNLLLTDTITGNNDWSIGTTYDANGNALTTTDAKGIVTTHTYDALDRPETATYSDGTPAITNTYDNVANGKGQLIEVSNSVSTTKFTQFDKLGQPIVSQQITEGNTYTTTYQYNLSGALIQETYPSGRVVKNDYDANNEISKIY